MKIWFQSNIALRSDPKWARYTQAIEKHVAEVKRPDTEVRVEGVEKQEKNLEGSAFSRHVNVRQVLDLGLKAQNEGYDAFVMAGLGTAGHEELRAELDIAVVYAEAVVWDFAVWQYGRFGIIGHGYDVYFRRVEQIRVRGCQDRFAPGDYCNFNEHDIAKAFDDPARVIGELRASTLRSVRDGARVLIPSFNVLNDLLVSAGVREFHGIPVMDTGGIALKMGEFLVDARQAGLAPGTC